MFEINISRNKSFFSHVKFKIYLIFIIPFLFLITNFFFGIYFLGDTLGKYQLFKFFHNYLDYYKEFPLWLDINYGFRSVPLINELGSIGIFFSYISSIFNINSYFAFIIFLTFNYSIFFYGIYLNLKKLNSMQLISIIAITLTSDALLFNFYFSLNWCLFLPYVYYLTKKYFKTFKIINILKISLIFFITFLDATNYTIIPIFYIYLFIIIFFFVSGFLKENKLSLRLIYIKKILNSFIIKKKYLYLIIFSFFGLLFYRWSIENIYAPMTQGNIPYRDFEGMPFKVSFDTFQNYGYVPANLILRNFLSGKSDQYLVLPPAILIFPLLFIIIFNFKRLYKKSDFQANFLIIFILILISVPKIDLIDKIIYSLPLFDYFRHKVNLLSLVMPFILLLIGNIVLKIENNNNNKIIFFAYFIVILYFSVQSLLFQKTTLITVSQFLQFLFSIFLLEIIIKKKNVYIKGLFIILVCLCINYLNSYKYKYHDLKTFHLNKKIHISDKINFTKKNNLKCLYEQEFKHKYGKIIDYLGTSTYAYLGLLTEDNSCDNFLRYFLFNNHDLRVAKVGGLIPNFEQNFITKKKSSTHYILYKNDKENDYKGVLDIAYDNKWIIKNDNGQIFNIEQYQGLIKIDLPNNDNKLNLILQTNNALFFYTFFKIISGLAILSIFLITLFKKR